MQSRKQVIDKTAYNRAWWIRYQFCWLLNLLADF